MTEMNLMERLSRAICREAEGDPDEIVSPSAELAPQARWKWYVLIARAALTAIREPTLQMSLVGMAQIMGEMKSAIPPEMFDRAFTRAIDKALEE
jgi:hypothetical protein